MLSAESNEDPRSFAEVVAEVPWTDGNGDDSSSNISTEVDDVPVTKERHVLVPDGKNSKLREAGVPRANQAATRSHPKGTTENGYNAKHAKQSVLQQHVIFFDRDNDGIIWPLDTYRGFHQLGFGIFLSLLSMFIIHTFFSYPTLPGILPDPFFRVHVNKIHRDKHGSDSGSYDNYGRFVPQKFEDFFEEYSSTSGKDGLTIMDTVNGIIGQRCIFDPVGWGAAIFEWLATWILLWPKDRIIKKEDVRGVYDGSIFWTIAERRGHKVR